jgi:hypothetical protein
MNALETSTIEAINSLRESVKDDMREYQIKLRSDVDRIVDTRIVAIERTLQNQLLPLTHRLDRIQGDIVTLLDIQSHRKSKKR